MWSVECGDNRVWLQRAEFHGAAGEVCAGPRRDETGRPMTLHHVTLNTGHRRASPRHEVETSVLEILGPCLAEALAGGGHVELPAAQCTLTATADGGALLVSVWGPPVDGYRAPLVTLGVASDGGAGLWGLLHEGRPELATCGTPQPAAPWVAARLDVGLALHPEAAGWLGDFERCIAWTWMERGGA